MPHFRLTPAARESLKSIGRYTEQRWGKAKRNTYLRALDRRFHDLAASPLKGCARDELHKQMRSYPEGSHVIFYLVRKQEIVIVDVLHERMDAVRHVRPAN